ncbi:helix-turn-helix domain-containing protein [uncultured Methanosphaera sp.]|jgi:DNA-binding HxlR family transcriptional regulator|uniref:winged helix-turn-helix transcriptional regulator n=1 Tax=uncultured Methanosphaera sp. TaxID=262501 RepID=UPI000DC58C57|nr:helix-turn-helix domain-containing protein [uncultured Methanosphaera sp.]RAP44205.1 MAG: hypothetical protein BZ134_04415 [Methanosphaera sp. SHI1033]
MSNKKCPARQVETLIKVITKRWNLQILYDMFNGKRHFNEFKENKPDLLNKTLSRCLHELESNYLIIKKINSNDEKDTEYILTENGRLLNRVIYDLMVYSMEIDKNNEYFTEEYKKIMKKQAKITLNIE